MVAEWPESDNQPDAAEVGEAEGEAAGGRAYEHIVLGDAPKDAEAFDEVGAEGSLDGDEFDADLGIDLVEE